MAGVRRINAVAVIALLVLGCSKADQNAAPATPPTATTLPGTPAPDAPPPPPTDEAANWTPTALDELLAPIALYPDVVLAQVLAASTNAQEVLDAGNWLLDHQGLSGDALTQAAAEADFSPSVQALVHFPTVLDMMCRELDWTRQVGDAFAADQGAVLAAVQRLRAQAADVGNLASTPQMAVEKTVESDKPVIVIQPANPQVVYVPQYNPTTVYTAPPPTTTTTTTTGISTSDAVIGGLLAFGAGVLIGSLINDNDNHYYCYPNWGYGGVYYGPRPYYPHYTFVYAPHYPGYRPAPYYRPPVAYPYQYNRYGNTHVNVNVTNNYFNRFEGNRNRVATYQPRSPVTQPQPRVAPRPSAPAQPYQGAARPAPATRQPPPTGAYQGASRPAPPAGTPPRTQPAPRSPAQTGARPPVQTVPRPPAQPASRPQTAARPQPQPSPQPTPRAQPYQRPSTSADRGYPQISGTRSDAVSTWDRGAHSFSGAGHQQGAMDRAASQRGRASMHSAQRPSERAAPQGSQQRPAQPTQQGSGRRSRS
jgi:hypothetical protein